MLKLWLNRALIRIRRCSSYEWASGFKWTFSNVFSTYINMPNLIA